MGTTCRYKNLEITLTSDPTRTSRLFWGSFHGTSQGETYTDEWRADGIIPALTSNIEVEVFWEFALTRGSEPEDDELPWDDQHISRLKFTKESDKDEMETTK